VSTTGNGGTCLPEPCTKNTVVQGPEQCVELCEGNTGCAAAVYKAETRECWQRSAVDVAECSSSAEFTLLVKPSQPGPPSPPGPMLYAATLTDGPMPPLYGY